MLSFEKQRMYCLGDVLDSIGNKLFSSAGIGAEKVRGDQDHLKMCLTDASSSRR